MKSCDKKRAFLKLLFVGFVAVSAYLSGLELRMLVDLPTLLYLLIGTGILSALRLNAEMDIKHQRRVVLQNLSVSATICLLTGFLGLLSQAENQYELIRGMGVAFLTVPYAGVLWYMIHSYYGRCTTKSVESDTRKNNAEEHIAADDLMCAWGLTTREKEIVDALSNGWSNREIGEALFISETTVKKHLANIFLKAGTGNRQALIVKLHQKK